MRTEKNRYRTTSASSGGNTSPLPAEAQGLGKIPILFRQIATVGVARGVVVEKAKNEYQNERYNNNVYDDFKG
jgi:hypothetical protein